MTAETEEIYISIDLGTLRINAIRSFDIFIKVRNRKMILYQTDGEKFTAAVRDNLIDHKVSKVYIKKDDRELYSQYLADNLGEILADPGINSVQKAHIAHESITNIADSLFEKPSAEKIRQFKSAISATMDMILSDEDALSNLMRLTSHDFYTYTHSVNVGIFAIGLTKELLTNNSEHNMKELASGFFLHDIGKCSTPLTLLNKHGPLTNDEWTIMKRHPNDGYNLLEKYNALSMEARVIVMQHHERHDGSGYPDGINGDQINTYSKICCIADVFDALTSKRPYKKPLSTYDALLVMKDEMSGEFDPDFFARFVMLFSQKKFAPKSVPFKPDNLPRRRKP